MTKRVPRYSPEVRARAVRMVLDHQSEHASADDRFRRESTTHVNLVLSV
jgi:transposase-like protein